MRTLRETLTEETEGDLHLGPERPRVYSDLTSEEKDRYNADIQATNILLQGFPKDIYSLINHYTDANDIWDNVKMLLEGSELTKKDRESQLYNDFKHFRQHKEYTIHDYYVRFAKLINDMRNIKMTMSRMQQNSKVDRIEDMGTMHGGQVRLVMGELKTELYFKDKMLLMQAQENGVTLDEEQLLFITADDCDAFDSDVDKASTAQTMFMANFSSAYHVYDEADPSYDSDVLSEELHSVKMQLASTINHNKSMVEKVTSLKRDFKQKENQYLEEFLDMKALKEKVEDKLFKQDQSLQTVHMLCKPKPYYDEQKRKPLATRAPYVSPVQSRKCDEIERKNLLIANDTLIENCLSNEVFYIAMNSELNVSRFSEIHDAHTVVQACCLELETELSKLKDKIQKDDHDVMVKCFSNLEVQCLNLQLEYQHLKENLGNNNSLPAQDGPDLDSVFEIKKLKASIQGKDNAIRKLRTQISQLQETRSKADRTLNFRALDFQITQLTKKSLFSKNKMRFLGSRMQKLNNITRHYYVTPKVLAPGVYAIDVEPIPPRLRNNREVHLDYLKHLKENVATLREIVESDRI
nr:integrase, catalytic region, zinc finger, CCHC-type, peptidase aspartic, catalytic [Tanacetum cinerariifolium]